MSWLALSASFEYLCYGSTAITNFQFFQFGDRYRPEILTSKGSHSGETVNQIVQSGRFQSYVEIVLII